MHSWLLPYQWSGDHATRTPTTGAACPLINREVRRRSGHPCHHRRRSFGARYSTARRRRVVDTGPRSIASRERPTMWVQSPFGSPLMCSTSHPTLDACVPNRSTFLRRQRSSPGKNQVVGEERFHGCLRSSSFFARVRVLGSHPLRLTVTPSRSQMLYD